MKYLQHKAIIIGGGFAGKLACKALSPHVKHITILESNSKPADNDMKPFVPQAHHVHILLRQGLLTLEKLFPEISKKLVESGSIKYDILKDLRWYHYGGLKSPYPGNYFIIQQTRTLLEHQIQNYINDLKNVSYVDNVRVTKMLFDSKKTKLLGVGVKKRHSEEMEDYFADIIIDASGNGANIKKWITTNIHIPAKEICINLLYMSRFYEINNENLPPWNGLLVSPMFPHSTKGGVVLKTEKKNQFIVTLSSYLTKEIPKKDEDYEKIAESLPQQDIIQFMRSANPVTKWKNYKINKQHCYQFEKVDYLPRNLFVIGDSYCVFDPIFGQGMVVCALEAEALKTAFSKIDDIKNSSQYYYKACAKIVKRAWDISVAENSKLNSNVNKNNLSLKIRQWLNKNIFEISAYDPFVYLKLAQIMHMTHTPKEIISPRLVYKLVKHLCIKGKGKS